MIARDGTDDSLFVVPALRSALGAENAMAPCVLMAASELATKALRSGRLP